jgi:hypothetical protein
VARNGGHAIASACTVFPNAASNNPGGGFLFGTNDRGRGPERRFLALHGELARQGGHTESSEFAIACKVCGEVQNDQVADGVEAMLCARNHDLLRARLSRSNATAQFKKKSSTSPFIKPIRANAPRSVPAMVTSFTFATRCLNAGAEAVLALDRTPASYRAAAS